MSCHSGEQVIDVDGDESNKEMMIDEYTHEFIFSFSHLAEHTERTKEEEEGKENKSIFELEKKNLFLRF